MNRKVVLPSIAILFAVVTTLAGKESAKPLLVDAYIYNSNPCTQFGSCGDTGGITCQTGLFPNITFYAKLTGTTCTVTLRGPWSTTLK